MSALHSILLDSFRFATLSPSGAFVFSFFGYGFPFKSNLQKTGALFLPWKSTGHLRPERISAMSLPEKDQLPGFGPPKLSGQDRDPYQALLLKKWVSSTGGHTF